MIRSGFLTCRAVCKLSISRLQKKNRGFTLEKASDFAKVTVSGASRRYRLLTPAPETVTKLKVLSEERAQGQPDSPRASQQELRPFS